MSSAPSRLPLPCAWLRVLVLLLVLLVPAAHHGAHAHAAQPAIIAGEYLEYDVLDTVLRQPARTAARPAAPLRPAPRPRPASGVPEGRRCPVSPRQPYALHTVRMVVLRC